MNFLFPEFDLAGLFTSTSMAATAMAALGAVGGAAASRIEEVPEGKA